MNLNKLSLHAFLPARAIWEKVGENVKEAVKNEKEKVDDVIRLIEAYKREKKELGEVQDSIIHQIGDAIEIDSYRRKLFPPEFLRQMATEYPDDFKQGLAMHPNTPQDILEKLYLESKNNYLASNGGSLFILYLSGNPSMPPKLLADMFMITDKKNTEENAVTPQLYDKLASNPSTPPAVLQRLAAHQALFPKSYIALAKNPSSPDRALMTLAGYRNEHILSALVANPNAGARVLEEVIATCKKINNESLAEQANEALERRRSMK